MANITTETPALPSDRTTLGLTWNQVVRQIFQEQYALMVRKQQDYGPGNIAAFGELGVLVRLSDKFERLKHLLVTQDDQGRIIPRSDNPANESIDDSYRDLLNYALIALMVRHGQWNVPFDPADTQWLAGPESDSR